MIQPDLLHPSDLDADDVQAWSRLQAGFYLLNNPLLGPQFAQAVGEVRDDARVAVWRQDGRAVAFLPHHRRPNGFARPIGGPFSDYHALVADPEFAGAGEDILGAAGVRALRVAGLIDPDRRFGGDAAGEITAYRIALGDDGPAGYLERLARRSRHAVKNHRRYSRKLISDFGPLRIAAPDRDPAAFERLLAWKSAQLRGSGVHDFLHVGWMRALLTRLLEMSDGGFGGMAVNLYAGDRHVAGHFGVRLNGVYHPWISAADPALKAYSPGVLHQWEAIAEMPAMGLHTYDLGPGNGHWKAMFGLETFTVRSGLLTAATTTGRLSAAQERLLSSPALNRIETVGRLRRRLDQIAAMELTLGGRVRGLVTAIVGYERRNATRRPIEVGEA